MRMCMVRWRSRWLATGPCAARSSGAGALKAAMTPPSTRATLSGGASRVLVITSSFLSVVWVLHFGVRPVCARNAPLRAALLLRWCLHGGNDTAAECGRCGVCVLGVSYEQSCGDRYPKCWQAMVRSAERCFCAEALRLQRSSM